MMLAFFSPLPLVHVPVFFPSLFKAPSCSSIRQDWQQTLIYNFLYSESGWFLFMIYMYLPKAFHPIPTLLLISCPWTGFPLIVCPRYVYSSPLSSFSFPIFLFCPASWRINLKKTKLNKCKFCFLQIYPQDNLRVPSVQLLTVHRVYGNNSDNN